MKNREKKIKVKDCLRALLYLDPRAVVSCVVARPGGADIGVSLCCTERKSVQHRDRHSGARGQIDTCRRSFKVLSVTVLLYF